MTTIGALTPPTDTGSQAQNNINANFDLFVSMLTAQARNQDPLNPMDGAEYTNQLVQYSMVEQQMKSIEKMEDQLAQLKTQSASQFVNYIGKDVTANGSTTQLANDSATWNLKSGAEGSASIKIRNSDGAVVYSQDLTLKEGDNSFIWNGVGTNGVKQQDGAYSIEIVTEDARGQAFTVQAQIKGRVDAVDFASGNVVLKMGDVEIPVGNITGVDGT